MIRTAFFFPALLVIASHTAQSQPRLVETSWGHSDESFTYRNFVDRKVRIVGLPIVIDENISYFKSRQLDYTVEGESAVKGQIWGIDESGNTRFEAAYVRNSLSGLSRTFHTNGVTRDSGMLVMNIPEGEWKLFNTDGSVKSIRQYNAYMWYGIQWSIQLDNPFWNRYELAEIFKKRPYAFYKAVIADETFNNQYSPPFYYCVQHGKSVNYYPNGSIADSGYFFQGLRDGLWVAYHQNGVIKEMGSYEMGEKNGNWKKQYDSGKLAALFVYRHGRVVQSKEYAE